MSVVVVAAPTTVLIVDDDVDDEEIIRELARHVLERAGLTVLDEAENGVIWLEQYRQPATAADDTDPPVNNGRVSSVWRTIRRCGSR